MHRVCITILAASLGLVAGCGGDPSKTGDRERGATAAPIAAAGPTVRVTGRVTYQGAPVEGAFLILSSKTTGDVPDLAPGALFSDASGAFAVDAPVDVYDVLAVTTDGLVAEASLDLTAGSPAPLDLTLKEVDLDPGSLGPNTLMRLLSGGGPLEPDASLLSEDDQ